MTTGQEDRSFDPNQASTGAVKSWLMTALDSYFDDDSGRWAFTPLELEIGRQADLAHDLKEIYRPLSATAKSRWRRAVTDLLAEHGHDSQRREATGVLVDLAVLMPAYEVLEVLPGIVANASEREAKELYDLVVAAAVELARQTEAARSCLELPVPHIGSLDFMNPPRYRVRHGSAESGRTQLAGQSCPTSRCAGQRGFARHDEPRAGRRPGL